VDAHADVGPGADMGGPWRGDPGGAPSAIGVVAARVVSRGSLAGARADVGEDHLDEQGWTCPSRWRR
jgi:hypothetical protein